MGFFKKVTKAVSKPVSKVVKTAVKDAVPIAAAVMTGGASLSVLKPTETLGRLDKITGQNVSGIAGAFGAGLGQGQSIEEVAQGYAEEKAAAEGQRVVNRQIAKQNSSKKINSASQSSSKPISQSISETASEAAEAVTNTVKKNKTLFIVGGAVSVLLIIVLIARGRRK